MKIYCNNPEHPGIRNLPSELIMKKDLDELMNSENIDAIWVLGSGRNNPAMVYLTGGVQLTRADLIKKHSHAPVLYHAPMERDEAALTGLKTVNIEKYHLEELQKKFSGDALKAAVERYASMFSELGLTSSRIAVYGRIEAGEIHTLLTAIRQKLPDITWINEFGATILNTAMITKDAQEVERIRKMGNITVEVVGLVADYLSSQKAKDGLLVNSKSEPVTVGDVKSKINLFLAERGVENPQGTIFASGYDAGVPHSSGKPGDRLQLGVPIVFDIFPCESGGGYYYDFTRTWCLGYAPDAVQSIYEDVHKAYKLVMGELQLGESCKKYQKRVCEFFETKGHPTIKSNPQTQDGFVHSLGHGLGLNLHERPYFGITATDRDRLDANVIVTIEPGLYYPGKGLGVRLEDTVWVKQNGQFEILAEYPYDLVLPVKNLL